MAYTDPRGIRRARRTVGSLLLPPLVLFVAVALAAAIYVAYVLWPRWPGVAVAPDAPALPITIAGVAFNVPPAAIRVPIQRRPGAQQRIDLVFLWPSLAPPVAAEYASASVPADAAPAQPADRLYVTIAVSDDKLSAAERFKTIYPRFLVSQTTPGPDGLVVVPFRLDTPYQGEELVHDPSTPEKFLVRCTKDNGPIRGSCLSERRVGAADITVRFPRDWLADWRSVAKGVDRLIDGLRP